jgi:murein hydrolase activator
MPTGNIVRESVKRALLLGCCLFLVTALNGQEDLRHRQEELQNLRDQIRQFEEKIKAQARDESSTLEILDNYDRQGTLLRVLISRLHVQESDLQKRIEATRSTQRKLEAELEFLKQHYAAYIRSVYKAGRIHDAELLLTSASLNQFYLRSEYLQRFAAQRRSDARRIQTKRRELERLQARAQVELTEERRMIAAKAAEEDRMTVLADERRDVLGRIRKDKSMLQRELTRKTQAARDLEGLIARLIEADRVKREREAEEARKHEVAPPPPPSSDFHMRRGSLPWPVAEGTIVAHFGSQRHPTLKTITQNIGVDIAVKPGTEVHAVAAGEVSYITWLPSYGNLLILNHYGGYRTVYTHLAEIQVAEGQKVGEGENLGVSGESLDGPRLHFEIWKDQDKQDPEYWLAKK